MRPPVEVLGVAVDRPGDRALLALRAGGRGRRPRSARPAWRRRRSGAGPSPARVASSKSPAVEPVVHEHHVEVAGVRQLGAAEAPEGDHGERQRRPNSANGASAASRLASASAVMPRADVADRRPRGARRVRSRRGGDGPSTGAAPAGARRARPASRAASVADSTSCARSRVASRAGSGSRATSSGLRWSVSAASRVVPTRWQRRRAASGDSRNARVSSAERSRVVEQVAHVEQAEVGVGALRRASRGAAAGSAASAATPG